MTYQERAAQAREAKSGKQLNLEIKSWDAERDEFTGKLSSVSNFEGGKFDGTCKQYVFEGDDGMVSMVLGSAMDKALEGKVHAGMVLNVLYKGKKHLDDGRQVNCFVVTDITDAAKQ
jgi:hypothetical protein